MEIAFYNYKKEYVCFQDKIYFYSLHDRRAYKRFLEKEGWDLFFIRDQIKYYELDEIENNNKFEVIDQNNINNYLPEQSIVKCFYKEMKISGIQAMYELETWIEIKNTKIKFFYQIPNIYKEVRFDYYEKDLGYNHNSYFEKFGKRVPCARDRGTEFVQPIENIDKIIGIKRYRDTNWIGTDRELGFTGETEEIVLDMHNFDEKVYEFFRQHEAFEIKW